VRRIEAISGNGAFRQINEELGQLEEVRQLLKSKDVLKSIQDLQSKNLELTKQLEKLNKEKANRLKKELNAKFVDQNGVRLLVEQVDLEAAEIKDMVFQWRAEMPNALIVIGSESGGKPLLTVGMSDALVSEKGLNASAMIRELAKEINGGGGGQPFFATAGGSNASGLTAALNKAKILV
jgi:alanyl-tRNA synthetase